MARAAPPRPTTKNGQGRSETIARKLNVCVMAMDAAVLEHKCVNRPGGLRLLRKKIAVGHHTDLVGNGNVQSGPG